MPARSHVRSLAALLLMTAALAACEEKPPEKEAEAPPVEPRLELTRVAFADLPGWSADEVAAALPAIRRSCDKLTGRPEDAAVGPDALAGTVADWKAACAAARDVAEGDDAAARSALEAHFVPFAATGADGDAQGLFTGYYEASLNGARTRHGPYQYPLYRKPNDLITADLARFRADLEGTRIVGRVDAQRLVPYYTRAQIAEGALAERDLELIWSDDPVDVFFLHVQGSGVVELPDGGTQRVGYAANNGHEFTAIGRELIRSGVLDGQSMSMQAIRDWLRAHPERADDLMRRNARYIFFREIHGPGPIGAQGVALTAGRSLAVDPSFLPLGAPLYLSTTYPATDEPLNRLMVAQDTGGAIKGPVRGDFFWGSGESALAQAGRMKQEGRYWLLLPKPVAERRGATS